MVDESAIKRLKQVLLNLQKEQDQELLEVVQARDEVINRYQPIFNKTNLHILSAEEFKGFLLFKNNHHWKAIHRQGNQIVEDMDLLREALGILLNEDRSLIVRLEELRPKSGKPKVKGLARSVITPILLVSFPEKYGVLNQIAATGMQELGVWPEIERGAGFASKYVAVNEVLNELAKELQIDLWTLDSLWWRISPESPSDGMQLAPLPETESEQVFGLELHLHDFLRDNWDRTELGRDWALLEEDGELVGYKYNTREVGEIDLLAHHRSEARWLVVELKRYRTSDQAVGQVLRYRGWVKQRLSGADESVDAMVIAYETDPKLLFALAGVDGVSVLTYSVNFSLQSPEKPWEI